MYAVIFTTKLRPEAPGYHEASRAMMERVAKMPGFLHAESVRDAEGNGITVSYWDSLESLRAWGMDPAHRAMQEKGKSHFYSEWKIRIARVEEERP